MDVSDFASECQSLLKICSLPSRPPTPSSKFRSFLFDNKLQNGPVSKRFASGPARVKSFESSPFCNRTCGLTPQSLSRAGLYYFGDVDAFHDAVRCFYCGTGLFDFKDDDLDAMEIHASFMPDCPFIVENICRPRTDEERAAVLMKWKRKHMSIFFASFVGEDVVSAVLSERWDQHYKFFESFNGFAHAIASKLEKKVPAATPPTSDIDTCKVCLEKQIYVLFHPCSHLVCCHDCSLQVKDCPYCRAPILNRLIARFT